MPRAGTIPNWPLLPGWRNPVPVARDGVCRRQPLVEEHEPRDLVLVLVGQELVEPARDGVGEAARAGDDCGLTRRHGLDGGQEVVGEGAALIGGQVADEAFERRPELVVVPSDSRDAPGLQRRILASRW